MAGVLAFFVSHVICIPFARRPLQDLTNPENYGMRNTVNVRITTPSNEEIGAWYCGPIHLQERLDDDDYDEKMPEHVLDSLVLFWQGLFKTFHVPEQSLVGRSLINDDLPEDRQGNYLVGENEAIILYLHGNAETRSQLHRRQLYRVFQKAGFHVLAIDYRGYGDSSYVTPSQTSMVRDSVAALNWIFNRAHPKAKVIVWGHSLGTGVATKLGATVAENDRRPDKYVLEAPFNRMLDIVREHKAAMALEYLSWNWTKTLEQADLMFDSETWIRQIKEPVLILHAQDDEVIPFTLANQLYENSKNFCNVHFYPFDAALNLRHCYIVKDKDLPTIIQDFVQDTEGHFQQEPN